MASVGRTRNWRRKTMEQDLVALSSGFLKEHFHDRLADTDRAALEQWLSSQLEHERRGWKQTLQMSLHEVERERRRASDSIGAIQELNTKVETYMDELLIAQQPSVYYAADVDIRDSAVNQLERNLDAILESIKYVFEERRKCFACLGIDEEPGSRLHLVLSDRLIGAHTDAERMTQIYTERNDKLKREIESMVETLNAREMYDSEREAKHMKEIKALTEIISRLNTQNEAKRRENKIDQFCQVDMKGSDSQDCSTQVAFPVTNQTSDSGKVNGFSSCQAPAPIKSVTISQSNNSQHEGVLGLVWPWQTAANGHLGTDSLSTSPIKPAGDHNANGSDRKSQRLIRSLDATRLENKHTVETLRSQVVEFAERLAEAKQEMENYQNQLAWMKSTPHSTLVKREIEQIRKHNNRSPKYDDGFLSGARKDILPTVYRSPDVVLMKSHLKKKHQCAPVGASNTTSRCLRCHKLYKVRDNHRKACKYHPRGKKKIEKYNGKGKLVTVAFLWECCFQATDAVGCASGEHI